MRTITDLIKDGTAAWIFCRDEATGKRFLKDAENEGYRFGDGVKPTERHWHYVYVPHQDKTLAHQSVTMWAQAFSAKSLMGEGGKRIPLIKVDYAAYIAGAEDFICKTPGAVGSLVS